VPPVWGLPGGDVGGRAPREGTGQGPNAISGLGVERWSLSGEPCEQDGRRTHGGSTSIQLQIDLAEGSVVSELIRPFSAGDPQEGLSL